MATFYLALAVVGWIAASQVSWRIPVLAVLTIQYVLHSINHALDVDRAHNSWAGPFDVVSLGLAAIQFVVLLWLLLQRHRGADAATP